jgi:hypothetical protein
MVIAHTTSTPMKLVVGSTMERRKSVSTIDPAFLNRDATAYRQKVILKRAKLKVGKDLLHTVSLSCKVILERL